MLIKDFAKEFSTRVENESRFPSGKQPVWVGLDLNQVLFSHGLQILEVSILCSKLPTIVT
jgi:hypothetical protein